MARMEEPRRQKWWIDIGVGQRAGWWSSGRQVYPCFIIFGCTVWTDVWRSLSSRHAAQRAGLGMLVLFALSKNAALNPSVVFVFVWVAMGPWRLIDYSLHTQTKGL